MLSLLQSTVFTNAYVNLILRLFEPTALRSLVFLARFIFPRTSLLLFSDHSFCYYIDSLANIVPSTIK